MNTKILFRPINIMLIIPIYLIFCLVITVDAMTLEDTIDSVCSRTIPIQDTFNSDGRIRADQIRYCVPKNGEGALLILRTAAMNNERFRGSNHSPWIHLTIFDSQGKALLDNINFALADVVNCGGYQQHVYRVPASFNLSRVFDVRIQMGGAKPERCNPSGIERIVKDLQTSVLRYTNGDFTAEERQAIILLLSFL